MAKKCCRPTTSGDDLDPSGAATIRHFKAQVARLEAALSDAGEGCDICDIPWEQHDAPSYECEARQRKGWLPPEVREQVRRAIEVARRHGSFEHGWVVARLDEAAAALEVK